MSRRTNDDYPTESAMLVPLLDLDHGMLIPRRHRIFEPCAGNGGLASPLANAGNQIITNDIDPQYNTDFCFDASVAENWQNVGPFEWVVTNPPWTSGILEGVMDNSLSCSIVGVAMLLRLSANEPVTKRSDRGHILEYWKDQLRYIQTFSGPRPKFDPTKTGTDSVTSAWFVWHKGWSWKAINVECPFQYVWDWKK